MAQPQTLPAPVPLRDLAFGAIAELVVGEVSSTVLRDLETRARHHGLTGGNWAGYVAAAIRRPHAEDGPMALIGHSLSLSPLEVVTLALLASVDEDPMRGRAIAELQQPIAGSRPSLGLVAVAFASLVPDERPMQLLLSGNAMASGLYALSHNDRPLAERVLSLPTPISLALRGYDAAWPNALIGRGGLTAVALGESTIEEAKRQGRALLEGERSLVIRSASTMEGRAVAATVAESLGLRPVFLDGDQLDGLGPWLLLRRLAPVFCFELGPGEHKRVPALPHYAGPVLVVTGPDGSIDTGGTCALQWTIDVPPPRERVALWNAAIGPGELATELATQHRHSTGRIAQLGRLTRHGTLLDGATQPTREHVQAAAWVDEGHGLGNLAQPMRNPVPDEALVTTPTLRAELDHLLLRCRARDGLDEGLGASLRARYRPGVRALFVGASGTGKTLAAGWLATQLGMPLFRVDLASVTSKYIGETEKNLAQLMARAEHSDVILLFDEADSLFGKRTDVKDANDRFANAQTNYLLQRIESFDGITLLTSNSRSRFDNAFSRRLDAILEFALPGPEERRALWYSHLGTRHSLTPRSVNRLAVAVDLAGGHIRNVVLTAAVLAQSAQRVIEFADIVAGLTAELRKLGRIVPEELRTTEFLAI